MPETAGRLKASPVRLDSSRAATSDAQGLFRFSDVPEGVHRIRLAVRRVAGVISIRDKRPKAWLTFTPIARLVPIWTSCGWPSLKAGSAARPVSELDKIVVRITGTDRYTTPDPDGNFYFYNLREGKYELSVDQTTLPEYAALTGSARVAVTIAPPAPPDAVSFTFEVRPPEKNVRRVFDKK